MKNVRYLWLLCGLFTAAVLFSSCGSDDDKGVDPDTTPPTVSLVSPADDANNIAVTSSVSVTFSEAIDPATINDSTFLIEPAVAGTFVKSGAVITFKPTSDLDFITLYIVTVTTGVKDVAGNALAEDHIWGFTTLMDPKTGVKWTSHLSGITTALNGIAWDGSKFVVVGDSGKILYSSTDDIWTPVANTDTNKLNAVAWSGTVFAAVGDGGTVLVSLDGATWQKKTSTTINNLNDITAYKDGFVAVGDSGTILKAINDGTGWAPSSASLSDSIHLQGITVADPQLFVAVGILDTGGVKSSVILDGGVPDLLSVRRTDSELLFYGVTWSQVPPNIYVAVGSILSGDSAASILSPTGTSWVNPQTDFITSRLSSVTWTGEMFVAVGNNGNIVTSTDGTNWTPQAVNAITFDLYSVIWTGSRLAAVDASGNVYTSP